MNKQEIASWITYIAVTAVCILIITYVSNHVAIAVSALAMITILTVLILELTYRLVSKLIGVKKDKPDGE